MRINNSFPVRNYTTQARNIQKNRVFNTALPNDQFVRSNEVSFGTIKGTGRFNDAPDLIFLPGVDTNYALKVMKEISRQPKELLEKFKKEDYKIVIAKTLKEAYESQGIKDPLVSLNEQMNPLGTLGAAYTEGKFGRKFLAFCDKPPYSNDYMGNIVNHEFARGLVDINGLNKNSDILSQLSLDINEIDKKGKINKLSPAEKQIAQLYFFNGKTALPVDEIIADTIAWNKGKGCYGSGMILNANSPDFMNYLFTNLSNYLKEVV